MKTDLTKIERESLLSVLKALYELGKKQSQTGFDVNGRPLTQKDFAILNRARAQMEPKTTKR